MRVVTVGNAMVDVVARVPHLPLRGGDVLASGGGPEVGGGGFRAIAAAAAEGVPAVFGGRIGTGPLGDLVRAALRGIPVPLPPVAGQETGTVLTLVEPDGERTFATVPGAESATPMLDRLAFEPGDHVHVHGYGLVAPGRAAAVVDVVVALPADVVVLLDPGPFGVDAPAAPLARLLARLDWWSGNAAEARAATGLGEPADAARLLAGTVRRGAVVRLGAGGCLLALRGAAVEHLPAPAVTAVDTNGAGDVHVGTFLARLALGDDPRAAACRANGAAAAHVARAHRWTGWCAVLGRGVVSRRPGPGRTPQVMSPRRPRSRCSSRSRRAVAVLSGVMLCVLATGCTSSPAAAPRPSGPIRTEVSGVSPYPPSNSVWYDYPTLRAKQPFARWEQERDRIEVVTWPADCENVPIAISFPLDPNIVQVGLGPAPRSFGPRQCRPGQVLTSTFLASRTLRRDRATTLLLGRSRVLLPPAPGLRLEPVSHEVSPPGTAHPLRQVNGPLPQYSVRDFPWGLTAPVTPTSDSISIGWVGGTCQPNASIAYVAETASTVTIDTALAPPPLRPQPDRSSSNVVCAGVGTLLTATIRLSAALGHRTLLQHQYVQRPADENAY